MVGASGMKKYLCKYSSSDLSSRLSGNNEIKFKNVNLAVRLLLNYSVVKTNLLFIPVPFRKDLGKEHLPVVSYSLFQEDTYCKVKGQILVCRIIIKNR